MNTKVDLCHIDSNRCVVRVSGFDGERDLGSALGEAINAEEAEDRARLRLEQRRQREKQAVEQKQNQENTNKKQAEDHARPPKRAGESDNKDSDNREVKQAKTSDQAGPIADQTNGQITMSNPEPSEAPTDPEDWSEELTAIDLQLKRIGWTRDHESRYLERAYGHGSRHKLTRYNDLVSYLNKLKNLSEQAEAESAPTPLRRSDLIAQGDEILTTLKWDQDKAKQFLQTKIGATTRQHLSDEQLFEFNMLLEEKLIAVNK